MGFLGVLGLDRGSGVHREENHGGSRGSERRGNATGEKIPLPSPSVLSVASVVKIEREGGDWRSGSGGLPRGFFRITTEDTGDTEVGEGGRGFGVTGRSRARSREQGRGVDTTEGIGEREQGGRRTAPGPPLSCSVCPLWWTRFSEHRREQSGYGGTGKKHGFVFARSPEVRVRYPGPWGGHHGGPWGNGNREGGEVRTGSSPTPLCSRCPLW